MNRHTSDLRPVSHIHTDLLILLPGFITDLRLFMLRRKSRKERERDKLICTPPTFDLTKEVSILSERHSKIDTIFNFTRSFTHPFMEDTEAAIHASKNQSFVQVSLRGISRAKWDFLIISFLVHYPHRQYHLVNMSKLSSTNSSETDRFAKWTSHSQSAICRYSHSLTFKRDDQTLRSLVNCLLGYIHGWVREAFPLQPRMITDEWKLCNSSYDGYQVSSLPTSEDHSWRFPKRHSCLSSILCVPVLASDRV